MPSSIYSQSSVQVGDTLSTSTPTKFASQHNIPANKIHAGTVIRVDAKFVLHTKLDPCGKLFLDLVTSSGQVVQLGLNGPFGYYMQFDTQDLPVSLSAVLTCVEDGSAGKLEGDGNFIDINAGGLGSETYYFNFPGQRPSPYDTSVEQTWALRAAFDTPHADNRITMRQFVIEILS
jgi:hypothetical protein